MPNSYDTEYLSSGDDVNVATQSDLTLALDSDKYVYAKEKKFASEHFKLNKITGLMLFILPYIIIYLAALILKPVELLIKKKYAII